MQVEVDLKRMQTNFGGRGLSSCGDIAPFCLSSKRPKFPFEPWTIVHGGQKIESAKKFMQIEVDLKRMQINFGGHGFSSCGDIVPFCLSSKRPKFPFEPWAIVHECQKIELAKKFMQIEVDLKCMQTNFGGRGLSGCGDIAPFCLSSKRPKFPFEPWTIIHGGQKIELAQKIHASRG